MASILLCICRYLVPDDTVSSTYQLIKHVTKILMDGQFLYSNIEKDETNTHGDQI